MRGELAILNVGAGDTKLSFDKSKPDEVEHARKVVTEMIRSGFAILVQVGSSNGVPEYQRAKAFDPDTCEYIVGDAPAARKSRKGQALNTTTTRIPADSTRAIGVARSAGG